ncbi:MAG: DUF2807 domain-containing protein [Pedobacter sp.]
MKTSNKLLIAFAAALILIPILCIAYVSRVYYEKGDYASKMGDMDTYGPKPKLAIAFSGTGSAKTINIQGESKIHLAVTVIKGTKVGLEVSENLKGLVTVQFAANGDLQINVKGDPGHQENFGRIAISAPEVKNINVAGSRGISLVAEMDSLNLNLVDAELAQFNADTKVKHLNVDTRNVREITCNETQSISALFNLNNTSFKSDRGSFDDLTINSAGNSSMELNGGDQAKTINNLRINTLGKSDVKLLNMIINQCSGKFSDSTTVQMPAVNINQMYKVKK